jgi:energy-coupling factor transporter ATP-binding protein EcfA2
MQADTLKPPLIVENLSCRYLTREAPAFQGVSFHLEAGQIVLVAGTSGSGKTTLLRCINGLIPRSYQAEISGRILLNGEDPSDLTLAEISQIVGTVLQDPERQILGAFVRNEVAFGLENLGVPRDEMNERIEASLSHLGIKHLLDRQTFSLSGGEKQKVALAGVMVMRPDVLALDEPLANLDPASAREALALIRRLADEGKSILIIEHRVEDVLGIKPDLALLLEDGEVTYLGSAKGLLHKANYRAVKLPAKVVIERVLEADDVSAHARVTQPTADAPNLVTFEQVSFSYISDQPVLDNVNLAIHTGDVIALLGPNGAGKTTLVKHAIGLLRPLSGRVLLDGQDSRDMTIAEMAHTVGYVFQSPTHMLFAPKVRDELAFGPKNMGHSEHDIQVNTERALAVVNLLEEIDRAPLALSFGQQKRVTIASVLTMRSDILVMDEPTAGQDYANYMSFMDSVVGLRAANGKSYSFSAIIFITHDLDLAVSYANRVVLMSKGSIVGDGKPQDVLADFNLLEKCRIVPTSLLRANLEYIQKTGGFMRAEELAGYI